MVDSNGLKWNAFFLLFAGSLGYQLTRRNLPFAVPPMIKELEFEKHSLGILESIMALTFSLGKITGGLATDYYSPKNLFIIGLIVVGSTNLLFGVSSQMSLFAIYWGINGYCQGGMGWPPVAKMMSEYYPLEERAMWWSAISSSSNIGGALIAIFGSLLTQYLGWRWTMILPGIFCILLGIIVSGTLRDVPIEKSESQSEGTIDTPQLKDILMVHIIQNFSLWLLSLVALLQYFVRTGILVWMVLFLIETRGFSTIEAGTPLFWFEVGGLIGGIAAGFISDRLFKNNKIQLMLLFMIGIAFGVFGFWKQAESQIAINVSIFFTGFCIYGPQVLIGVLATELVDKRAIGSAIGLIGAISGIGGTLAGLPASVVIQSKMGWEGFMLLMAIASTISPILLVLMDRTKRNRQET